MKSIKEADKPMVSLQDDITFRGLFIPLLLVLFFVITRTLVFVGDD